MEFRWRCRPRPVTAREPLAAAARWERNRVLVRAQLQSLTKEAKAAGRADGPSVILNEDDTDPAARQAAIYMNTQAHGDPARRDAGPISYV